MATVITTPQGQTYQKPSTGQIMGGVAAGSLVSKIFSSISKNTISPILVNKMAKINENLKDDEFKKAQDAIQSVVKNSGLGKKGVEIIEATGKNSDEIASIIKNAQSKKIIFKLSPKKAQEEAIRLITNTLSNGKNACYIPESNKIIVSKKLALSAFHELGHAANKNLSKIGKALQKSRSVFAIIPFAIGAIALFKTKKAPEEEPKNGADKATTFVKNNAGKLTFLAFLPTIIEEGMATFKGNGFAKKLLDPSLAKKVAKTNAFGFISYIGLAALSGIGIYLGVKIKDEFTPTKTI